MYIYIFNLVVFEIELSGRESLLALIGELPNGTMLFKSSQRCLLFTIENNIYFVSDLNRIVPLPGRYYSKECALLYSQSFSVTPAAAFAAKILFSTLILEAEDKNDIEQNNEKKLEFKVNEPQSSGVEALNVQDSWRCASFG